MIDSFVMFNFIIACFKIHFMSFIIAMYLKVYLYLCYFDYITMDLNFIKINIINSVMVKYENLWLKSSIINFMEKSNFKLH